MKHARSSKARTQNRQPKNQEPHQPLTWRAAAWVEGVCWVLFWGVLVLWVHPELHYQNAGPEVFEIFPFQSAFLLRPGGGLEWLYGLVLHGCQAPWLGALCGVTVAATACQALRCLLWLGSGDWPKAAHLLLGGPILLVLSQFERPAFLLVMGFTLALVFAAGAVWGSRRGGISFWLAPWVGVAVLYQVAGPATLIFLAAGVVVAEKRLPTPHWGSSLLLWGAAIGAVLAWHIKQNGLPLGGILEVWDTPLMKILAAGLAGWVVAVGLVMRWTSPVLAAAGQYKPWPVRWQRILWGGGMVAGGLAVWGCLDPVKFHSLRLDYLAARERWPELLAQARTQSRLTMAGWVHLLRGLYRTGELPESLFAHAVVKQDDLLSGVVYAPQALVAGSHLMLELGQVNHAERLACEAVEILGERPELLWVLARVHVLKGQPLAAGNYLRVLRRQPFQARRAGQWLAQLAEDPRLERQAEMAELRKVMVATDYTSPALVTAPLMQQLLHSNPTNRMALEFLLVHYLITGQLKKFTEYLGQYGPALHDRLPRHFEEAALLAQRLLQQPLPSGPGMAIREETRQRFRRFEEIVGSQTHDSQTMRLMLAREFGDTYWFFYWYGQTAKAMNLAPVMPP